MSEKQTNAEALTPQVEMKQVIIEWGPWPLWILAGVAVSSTAISSLSFSFVALILGGVIGGVFVGFMPYLANRWRITRVRWWAWIFVNLILIMSSLLICAYNLYLDANRSHLFLEANGIHSTTLYSQFELRLRVLFLFVVLGSSTGMVIGATTRWVCRRWLASRSSWWVWTIAGILIVTITFMNLILAALIFAQ